MLERVPSAKAVFDNPKHAANREMLSAAIKAQTPLLSNIKGAPHIFLTRIEGIDEAKLGHALRNDKDAFNLAIFHLLSGKLDEDVVFGSKLAFPILPTPEILSFAKEIGAAWDRETREDREWIKIYGTFAEPGSEESSLFSIQGNSPLRLLSLVVKAKGEVGIAENLQAISDFRAGKIDFNKLKEFYAEDGITLTGAEITDSGVRLTAGSNPVLRMNVERQLESAIANARKLLEQVAKRMSIGFNELL